MIRRRADRRTHRSPRRMRRLLVLGGTVSGIGALRSLMMARNEKRYADLIGDPSADRPR